LANPKIRSFFACGDFNQRLTTWGSRSIDDVKWVFPEIDIKEITVSYRQSRRLNDLARAIIVAAGGTDSGVTLPAHVDNEGVSPTLLEHAQDQIQIVDWLAQRIREIEQFLGQMPSIAIFVESEAEVQPVADALNEALAAENAQVIACPKGQVMGQDNDVRVFDVQHIKGLGVRSGVLHRSRSTGFDSPAALRQVSLRWNDACRDLSRLDLRRCFAGQDIHAAPDVCCQLVTAI
jgi:hypothetical protein